MCVCVCVCVCARVRACVYVCAYRESIKLLRLLANHVKHDQFYS